MTDGSAQWITARIPSRNMGVMLLCGVGLILIAALLVYPGYREARGVVKRIMSLRVAVADQRAMLPAHNAVRASNTVAIPAELVPPPPQRLDPGEVQKLPGVFAEMAKDCGLRVVSAVPSFEHDEINCDGLAMRVVARGEFGKFRGFVLRALAMPSCRSLERLEIRVGPEGDELFVQVRLAVKP
jgi:hypothetical protein